MKRNGMNKKWAYWKYITYSYCYCKKKWDALSLTPKKPFLFWVYVKRNYANLFGKNPQCVRVFFRCRLMLFPERMALLNLCTNYLHYVFTLCALCAIMPSFNCQTCNFSAMLWQFFLLATCSMQTIFFCVKISFVII